MDSLVNAMTKEAFENTQMRKKSITEAPSFG